MFYRLLWVGLGGFIGAGGRYLISGWVQNSVDSSVPYGTMVVNVAGSFFLGLLAVMVFQRGTAPVEWRLFFLTGVLGAFTTFSTFSYESIRLLQDGLYGPFLWNVFGNLVLCLTAAFAGIFLGRAF